MIVAIIFFSLPFFPFLFGIYFLHFNFYFVFGGGTAWILYVRPMSTALLWCGVRHLIGEEN